jgi:uncharacterized protein with HEPN domain
MPRSAREYLQHMIHRYFGVDYEIVWDVVTNKVPALAKTVRQMLEQETPLRKNELPNAHADH